MDQAFVVADTARYRLLTVQGEIVGATVAEFRLACASAQPLVVDLLRCTYIDSSGLSALIARNRSDDIALVLSPGCRVYRIFDITRLLQYFLVAETLLAAVALLGALPDSAPTIPDL